MKKLIFSILSVAMVSIGYIIGNQGHMLFGSALVFIGGLVLIILYLKTLGPLNYKKKSQLSDDEIKVKFGYKRISHHGSFATAETADGLVQFIDPATGEPF